MQPQTHAYPVRRVLVLADRDLALLDHAQLRQLTEAARGSHVRLVAHAGAVPGERWIIDLAAREAQARERLERWRDALAAHARAVEIEVGDADARLALADARHAFEPDTVLATTRRAGSAPWPQPSRRRWWPQPGTHALPVAA
jgi:predicted TIM-barrel enzyme